MLQSWKTKVKHPIPREVLNEVLLRFPSLYRTKLVSYETNLRAMEGIKGYFQDTLPNIVGPFCLVFIDCDLRDSLVYAAETLWPLLSLSWTNEKQNISFEYHCL